MRRVVSSSLLVAFGAVLVLIPTSCAIFKLFPRTVVVQAADDWLATGVNVDIGDLLRISATGEISYSPLYPVTGPNGDATVGTPAEADPGGAISYPMPDELIGALVGKIGSGGTPFLIGSDAAITADTTGELYVVINDNYMDNNSGFFDIVIEFEGGLF